ncbi:hypothetical protein [Aquimarina litoralis]|uniref:hypothetical protein n=1 Tax=Aquimarina litoralis TaxID=584605 RepID=UPI001C591D04|nr:hypothetical protein [Aquimarina litoralis]MBW1293973.1 hypothetical protein [Aquimarina litoralis]
MNKIVYIGLLAVLFSCKSNSIAQEKRGNTSDKIKKEKVETPKFGDLNSDVIRSNSILQNQMAPNTIYLTVIVLEVLENRNICTKNYPNVGRVKVKSVKGSGSGIVNMISQNQEIMVALRKGISKDVSDLKSKIHQEISIVVREKPCSDFNHTMYEIVSISGAS